MNCWPRQTRNIHQKQYWNMNAGRTDALIYFYCPLRVGILDVQVHCNLDFYPTSWVFDILFFIFFISYSLSFERFMSRPYFYINHLPVSLSLWLSVTSEKISMIWDVLCVLAALSHVAKEDSFLWWNDQQNDAEKTFKEKCYRKRGRRQISTAK